MESLIIIVHVVAAIAITGLVLLQQGKGAEMGASFGSGASQTLFGSTGSGNALTRFTSWMAVIFFATSLGLALIARQQAGGATTQQSSLIENLDQLENLAPAPQQSDLPQAPSAAIDLPSSEMPDDLAAELAGDLEADLQGDVPEEGSDAAAAAAAVAEGVEDVPTAD